jgi:putative ABC transport system permease protein
MHTFFQDLRYGVRMLLKSPGVTFIVILALALGIGANTAIFSVVNAVLLRPLPYQEADRLVFLNERSPVLDDMSISYPNFLDWRSENQVFEKIGVYNRNSYNLTGVGEAERLVTAQSSADLFAALRVNAAIGRVFTNDEDKPGGTPVVVLSYGLWQRRFGGQSNMLNQPITLNGKSYIVIGVMPKEFQYPTRAEMWVPVGQLSNDISWQQRGNHPGLYGVARLKPGVTIEQAAADMERVAVGLEKQYPNSNAGNRVGVQPLLEVYVSDIRRALWVLFAAVACVLLIACANIANLLLARSSARQKEMAIRAAMGAGRWRIARQLLTENVVLSLVGGTLGLLLARWGIDLILYVSPNAIPRSREIGLDWRVLGFTLGISVLTGVLFGLVPALQASVVDVHETLKEAGRGNTGRHWLRSSLVVVEVATTLVLLIGAGLLIRSFYRLQKVNPGFSYDRLTSFSLSLPEKRYPAADQQDHFFNQFVDSIGTLPGVQSVAAASGLPLGNNGWQTSFIVEGQPIPPRNLTPLMEACLVTPDYFRAMGIPLIRGRYFNKHDDRSALAGRDLSKLKEEEREAAGLSVLIIDEEFARRYWPNEEAIGKRIRLGREDDAPNLEVVGVVGRVKMEGLNRDSNRVQGYFAFSQMPSSGMTILVKGTTDPNQLKIGIRMAVGAQPADVFRMILRHGLTLTLIGIALGLVGAVALTRLMATMLFGVGPTDPLTYGVIAIALVIVALLACYVPGRRATKVDPLIALRYE